MHMRESLEHNVYVVKYIFSLFFNNSKNNYTLYIIYGIKKVIVLRYLQNKHYDT